MVGVILFGLNVLKVVMVGFRGEGLFVLIFEMMCWMIVNVYIKRKLLFRGVVSFCVYSGNLEIG